MRPCQKKERKGEIEGRKKEAERGEEGREGTKGKKRANRTN